MARPFSAVDQAWADGLAAGERNRDPFPPAELTGALRSAWVDGFEQGLAHFINRQG